MIISKDSNNNWTPVATGNGTFVGTKTAFDAVKDDLPDNTVAYTTDDGTEEEGVIGLSTTDVISFSHINTSTSAGTWTSGRVEIPETGLYKVDLYISAQSRDKVSEHNASIRLYNSSSGSNFITLCEVHAINNWIQDTNTVYIPLKAGYYVELYHYYAANTGSGDLGHARGIITRAIMG